MKSFSSTSLVKWTECFKCLCGSISSVQLRPRVLGFSMNKFVNPDHNYLEIEGVIWYP